jgi:MFS family permease
MKRSPLFVIFLTVFIDLLGFGIVIPLLPLFAARFAASDATIGLLMSSFSLMQFVFAPLWGRLSDRVGRRPILLIGLAASAACYAAFGYATQIESLALLFATRIGAGIAGATIPTAQAYIADSTTAEARGRGMAIIGAAFGLGFTFGPMLGSIWVGDERASPAAAPSSPARRAEPATSPSAPATGRSNIGRTPPAPGAPGYMAAGLSAGAFLLALLLLPESLRPDSKPSQRHWIDLQALGSALRAPAMGLLILTFFTATFAFANFEATLARLLHDAFHLTLRRVFYVFSYIGLILALTQGLVVRRLITRVGEGAMLVAGTSLMIVGLGVLGLCSGRASLPALLAVLPIVVTGFSALNPSVQALLSRQVDASVQGGVLGVAQSASALARIAGPFLGNVLYGVGSDHAVPYLAGAGLMVLAFALSLASIRL